MTPYSIITDVLIVLAAALLIGELFERFSLPSVVGEILSGMIIGPSMLGLVAADDAIRAVSSIALFFIIFHIGFEMRTQMVRSKLFVASLLSVTSFLVPLALMVLAALFLFPFGTEESFIVALAISVPSISIISVLVCQYNLLRSTTGQIILSSVTISDLLAFVILVGVVRPLESTLTIVSEITIFVFVFLILDWILNRKPDAFQQLLVSSSRFFRREDFSFVFLIIVALTVSVIFQSMGLSYILGAFFAGLIVHDGLIGRKAFGRISQTLSTMNKVFFIPLFFGFAGLEVMLGSIDSFFYVGLTVLIVIALGVGVSLTYYASKKTLHTKLDIAPKQVAGILGGRGAIGIVIATVAFSEGSIKEAGFSLVILATLIMSLAIPFLAGKIIQSKKSECDIQQLS
ncbi:MAG: cation:proton antiporter [Candidatus Bathyarchaeota archaeon]|nr:cation:proton antiporter [Candidatus Bathyarchaeota archaeon]